jgi:outer membrane protein assembly factor BamB
VNKIPTACLAIWLVAAAAAADPGTRRDWPVWSGPDRNLTSLGNGVFPGDGFGLEAAWSRPLGSGYSGISVAGDRLVTAFSDGEADYLVALDPATGVEQWRYRIADTYKGHDGSDDGPLATPTLADDSVYGLGAWGKLFAVGLADGKELWSHRLVDDFGARKPDYGFTTTPTVVGDLLVVETGGDAGRSISAFDRATGEARWSIGDDEVGYQSPQALTFGGRTVLIAVTNRHLYGLEPETGKTLFEHRHSEDEGNGFAQPVPVGEDGVLITDWPESTLYRVHRDGGAWSVEEVWKSRALRGTYAIPAPYQGHLYGYSGNFLTCVDAATGETVWKSRPPGEGNLVLVDGHLVIQTRDGDLVVAEATPEGYRETTRIKALDRGYLTRPSFAAGKVYVRNLSEIAAVGVTDPAVAGPKMAESRHAGADWDLRGAFGDFVEKVAAAEDKTGLIDSFMTRQTELPIVEGDLVHFVFRGQVDDLALSGNIFRDGGEHPMHHIEGTDFYFRTVELPPASYFT